jgi:hypothetical protein
VHPEQQSEQLTDSSQHKYLSMDPTSATSYSTSVVYLKQISMEKFRRDTRNQRIQISGHQLQPLAETHLGDAGPRLPELLLAAQTGGEAMTTKTNGPSIFMRCARNTTHTHTHTHTRLAAHESDTHWYVGTPKFVCSDQE